MFTTTRLVTIGRAMLLSTAGFTVSSGIGWD